MTTVKTSTTKKILDSSMTYRLKLIGLDEFEKKHKLPPHTATLQMFAQELFTNAWVDSGINGLMYTSTHFHQTREGLKPTQCVNIDFFGTTERQKRGRIIMFSSCYLRETYCENIPNLMNFRKRNLNGSRVNEIIMEQFYTMRTFIPGFLVPKVTSWVINPGLLIEFDQEIYKNKPSDQTKEDEDDSDAVISVDFFEENDDLLENILGVSNEECIDEETHNFAENTEEINTNIVITPGFILESFEFHNSSSSNSVAEEKVLNELRSGLKNKETLWIQNPSGVYTIRK